MTKLTTEELKAKYNIPTAAAVSTSPAATTTGTSKKLTTDELKAKYSQPIAEEKQQSVQSDSLSSKLGGRVEQFKTAMTQNAYPGQPTIGGLGAIAGGINDTLGAVISPVIEGATKKISSSPTVQKIAMSKPVSSALDVTNKSIGAIGNTYNEIEQAYPKTTQAVEDVANIVSLIPFGKGASVTANTIGDASKPLIQKGADNATTNLANNLNETFKQGTIGVKNISDYADERGINLGKEIANRKIEPIVDNDRLKFGTEAFKKLDDEIASDSRLLDDVIEQYPDTRILADDIAKEITQQIANDPILRRQGAVVDVTAKAMEKLNDLIAQEGKTAFTLKDIQTFKKGMWEASKKFKISEAGKADAFSELGKSFMKIVEREIPDVNVHNINAKLGRTQEVYKMLDKLNSLQDGGMVLKGGKVGKYATGVMGTGIGSLAGSAFGPLGTAIGGFVGYKATEILRNLSQKSAILGILDRVLIKYAKEVPTDPAIIEARAFIDAVKNGKKPTITPTVQNALENAWSNARSHIDDIKIPQEKGTLKIPSNRELKTNLPVTQTTTVPVKGRGTVGAVPIKNRGNIYYPTTERLPVIKM